MYSLSQIIYIHCTEYNATSITSSIIYKLYPICFSLICALLCLYMQNLGVNDFLLDGITDGSLAELINVFIIYISFYIFYSVAVTLSKLRKNPNIAETSPESRHTRNNKYYFKRHVYICLIYFFMLFLPSLVELLPLIILHLQINPVFQIIANISMIIFSFTGSLLAIIFINIYLHSKISKLFTKTLNQERKDISNQIHYKLGAIVVDELEGDKNPEEKEAYLDIVGTLSGICLTIDNDYETYDKNPLFKDASHYERINSELRKIGKNKTSLNFKGSKLPTNFLPIDSPINVEEIDNLSIQIQEYFSKEMHYLRIRDSYIRENFYESLKPYNNSKNLQNLFEKVSSKSGASFYITSDKKFILKCLIREEKLIFQNEFFEKYFNYIFENHSLLCKFFGIFKITIK